MEKSILITGCSSGIGYYIAHELQKRGYRVFATARKVEDVEKLSAEGLCACQLDLDDSQSIRSGLEWVLEQTGGTLYSLFNNGAYGQPGAVEDLSRDALRQQFETNFFGTQELTNLVLPVMRKQGYGRIIHNSSVLGFAAMAFRGAYNASKFALEGLTDTLRLELVEEKDIHISLIEPGPILSRFRVNALEALKRNIDVEASVHSEKYNAAIMRLSKKGATSGFTLGPDAVLSRVIHALEKDNPQARYFVTKPTYVFAFLKRILPISWLDKLLLLAGKD